MQVRDMLATLTFGLMLAGPVQASTPPGEAWRISRLAQRSIETETDAVFEREWQHVLSNQPTDRRALLALATLARLRYQYPRADSLYLRLQTAAASDSQYVAAASMGMALWRALGNNTDRADSLFSRARAAALAAGDDKTAAQAVIGLAQLRSRRSGPKLGLQLVREARGIVKRPTAEESAQLECIEGSFQDQLGDSTGSLRVIRGRELANASDAVRVRAACDVYIAQSVERSGYFEQAADRADEAVRLFERAHNLVGVAQASQWLGYVRSVRGYYSESIADLQRAVRSAQATHFDRVEAWARIDLADVYVALGDVESARTEAAQAEVLHARVGDLWGLAVDRRFEGLLLESAGQLGPAHAKFAEAVAAFRQAGLSFNAVEPLRLLALVDMRLGNLDSAEHALDEATRLARASGNTGWLQELPLHLAHLAMLRGKLRLADSLLVVARPEFPWRLRDTSDVSLLPAAIVEAQLAFRLHRVATADSAIGFVSSEITRRRRGLTSRDLRAGLAQLHNNLGGLSEAYPELVAALVNEGRLSSAFRFIESVRAREIADATLRSIGRAPDSAAALAGYQRLASTGPTVDLRDARRRLARDQALVILTLGLEGAPTTALIVSSDSAFAISLPARDVLAPLIDRYLRVASGGIEPLAPGEQLGAALLDPIARALPKAVTRLEISPDGDLFRVPFEALRLADGHYAVERFAISIVPSATVAQVLASRPAVPSATRLVAVGDPVFRPALARLPQSADEARDVATYGRSSLVLTRGDATKAALRAADLPSVGVLHFATHALIDDEGQARTALALTATHRDGGSLTTSEIASLQLNGALVVLSACESLGGQILGGEGLRGLSEPFLEAGARAVVVTQWSIGDRGILPFVDRFYASMAAGASVGDALRQSKLAAIRAHARFVDWAAFTVIGDASMHPALRLPRM
jgi:tetratricopeptide (TPR) repeat protein